MTKDGRKLLDEASYDWCQRRKYGKYERVEELPYLYVARWDTKATWANQSAPRGNISEKWNNSTCELLRLGHMSTSRAYDPEPPCHATWTIFQPIKNHHAWRQQWYGQHKDKGQLMRSKPNLIRLWWSSITKSRLEGFTRKEAQWKHPKHEEGPSIRYCNCPNYDGHTWLIRVRTTKDGRL